MSQLNLPRTQRNRMDMNGHQNGRPVSLIESESSSTSNPCSPTNEGYASDESSTSSVRPSILKRASYWQKRCEQGLISDCSVSEDFPPMEMFAKND
ncbi:unnamed protein product [Oppiella nova]|uniref:Uncharacterized protein n=1 Tax=Oppiella nova TaxID=334625 RepID=A0A7R9QH11_9ACAR|nr:unnamed protein product [Oppiella nova]CAG2165184.1 unnamed protein product [Oppiella nova]